MSLIKLTAAAVLLAVAGGVRADHKVTFKNSCPFAVQPMWKGNNDGAFAHKTSAPIPAGGSASASLPEIWESGRIYAQDPAKSCAEPDGGNCTLLECSFGKGSPRWWQCNISLVSGYNLPATLKFVGGKEDSCKVAYSCLSGSCPMSQAYRVEGCEQCINQCNTDNVGLAIEFCQAGSTVPNFGQGPSKPTKPTPKPADPKPQPQPERPVPSKPAETSPAQPPALAPSAPANAAAKPSPTPKHCSRARRRARRAHRRALLAHASH